MSRTITLFVLIAGFAVALAPTAAAAATPTSPSQAPYAGCTDWYLQSTYPMSADDAKWVFSCSEGEIDWDSMTGWQLTNYYYWNDELSQILWFETSITDLDDWWFYNCTIYPGGGACEA